MGIEHVTWALRKVRGVDTAAKMVLISLSNFADAAGLCWPSVATMVDDTGLSEATVKRRLADLVRVGAMRKQERIAPNKRQKSNIYVLDTSWTGPGDGELADGQGVDVTDGVQAEPHHGAQREPDGVQCEPHRGFTQSPPLTLNHQLDPSGKEEEEARALEVDFQKLVSAFDPGPTESFDRGKRILMALSADDRIEAIKHAPAFVKALVDEKRKTRPSIAIYLSERRWEAVARHAAKTPTQRTGGKVFVRKGTPWWEAWARHKGVDPARMPSTFSTLHKADGWYFDTQLPPRQAGQGATAEQVSQHDL